MTKFTKSKIIGVIFFYSFLFLAVSANDVWAADFCCKCAGPTSGSSCPERPAPETTITAEDATAARQQCLNHCASTSGSTIDCVSSLDSRPCIARSTQSSVASFGTNPICIGDVRCNVQSIVGRIIKASLGITGSIALAMLVYGGILWMLGGSSGNSKRIETAKNIIVWSALGLFVIFGSYLMVNFVMEQLQTAASIPTPS